MLESVFVYFFFNGVLNSRAQDSDGNAYKDNEKENSASSEKTVNVHSIIPPSFDKDCVFPYTVRYT